MTTPIAERIRNDINQPPARPAGPIATLGAAYHARHPRLLGFLLKLGYEEMTIVTNDVFKANCDGVPRNSFVMVKMASDRAVGPQAGLAGQVMLARVTEAVPTPIDTELQQTIFQVHKLGASVDAFTNRDLQWGAMKATILGTYYDDGQEVAFGNDVASFSAPHSYEVYVPTDDHLALLINSFVRTRSPLVIGELKFTESPPMHRRNPIPVHVDLDDFIGRDSANRTALFGKTRMGKSNTIKIIADGVLGHARRVAQLIFDPSGEYTYINTQDRTSIYALHRDRCVRYSLHPRLTDAERALGFTLPHSLRVNFYDNPSIAVPLVQSLFDTQFSNRPNYILPLLDWTPADPAQAPDRNADHRAFCRFWRTTGLWFAALQRAEYPSDAQLQSLVVHVPLRAPIKLRLAAMQDIARVARTTRDANNNVILDEDQPFAALPLIYEKVYALWRDTTNRAHFPDSDDGTPYFTLVDQVFLRTLGDRQISGVIYLRPFRAYHDVQGRNAEREIVGHLDAGRTVLVDYANAPEGVVSALSKRIADALLGHMTTRFAENRLGDHFVLIYFEEAHRLFRADDRDINSIYNRLAKEGAKFHIGMVYATQSMATLSPDLRKNTENFVIAHLNDDREIRELTQRFEFRDVGEDVMRARTRGYVRMITESHRYVLPVRIRLFGPPAAADGTGAPPAQPSAR
jgi:hypothetical protein